MMTRRFAALLIAMSCALGARGQNANVPTGVRIARAARAQIGVTTIYDPAYVRLAYPGGDVPPNRGVCADVVVRAFRAIGVDLQVELHRDMLRHFADYPHLWGLAKPDPNIDQRRVPNLMKFFERRGKSVNNRMWKPGDVVAWRLPGGLDHIGIVSEELVPGTGRPLMVHNIGRGAELEDILHEFTIIGHYRW